MLSVYLKYKGSITLSSFGFSLIDKNLSRNHIQYYQNISTILCA